MHSFRMILAKMSHVRFVAATLLAAVLATVLASAVGQAHELWIETDGSARIGRDHGVNICWGHSGQREGGARLAGQESKLTACLLGPGGRTALKLTKADDCFVTGFAPEGAGGHVVGAELQVGIIEREMHSIPTKTRIVMYGKSCVQVGGGRGEMTAPLGFDLEIVPVGLAGEPKPGDLVTVRVVHKGQPIGGKDVLLTAATSGPLPRSEDPRVQTSEWSLAAMADPKTGEATFPLIVDGQHLFTVKYFDETPGTYDGDRNDSSEFSHLRKGDKYERTMYVSTLTVQVRK
jgi:uncharacterized GH25 family protein